MWELSKRFAMMTHKVIRVIAVCVGLMSGVALMYGFAKVAMAEESKPVPVQVDLPGVTVGTPPDEAMRSVGLRALAVGTIGLFVSGCGLVYSLRRRAAV